ncbi:MAG: Endonuclease III [Candidatus Woesebacteria bacterium GW2011_GWA2_44_33]|uniref:Endonuclease III n=1 Tax=Candidatus Woesebacteria bacterium GW2011_GWA2_44_33 TaxID=1618564 RepID=A0A0G1J1M4_9BACT|nr:MAG: Endonuclease III [Candidatus Woesebacteria bacterium GW2011_GWA2_44_33]
MCNENTSVSISIMASQITQIVSILKKTYPDAKIVLNYGNNWELLVAVVLSAQCTDKKVNQVTAKLFPKFRAIWLSSRGRPSGRGDLTSARLPRRPDGTSGLLGGEDDFGEI